ncbi:ArsC family reductase [Orbaceae bacterium ac157xtp]
MLTIYGIKNCNTMKKAFNWLDEHGIKYQFHNYKTDGLDEATLNKMLALIDWKVLLNNKGMTWRNLSEAERAGIIDQQSASKVMLANPSIIKRPVIIDNKRSLVGFSESDYQQFFGV